MMEDELMKIWQSSPNQERAKFDTSRLMLDVQAGIDRLERLIRHRDLREVMAVAIIVPAFTYIGFKIPYFISKVASGLIILYALFVVWMIRKAKRDKPGPFTDSYLDYLHKSRKFLEAQKQLHDNIIYWYIIPGVLGVTLFTLGTGDKEYIIRMLIINSILAVVTYVINRRAARKTFAPKIEKINTLIQALETDSKK